MSMLDYIPEEDKICLNCKHWPRSDMSEYSCNGLKCCNWSHMWANNYFEPDAHYIKMDFAKCENCIHQDSDLCSECYRLERGDMWEWKEA